VLENPAGALDGVAGDRGNLDVGAAELCEFDGGGAPEVARLAIGQPGRGAGLAKLAVRAGARVLPVALAVALDEVGATRACSPRCAVVGVAVADVDEAVPPPNLSGIRRKMWPEAVAS
jgi:hypothetical protein